MEGTIVGACRDSAKFQLRRVKTGSEANEPDFFVDC